MAEYYIGEIRLLAFSQYAPANFLPCDGRAIPISQYQALFALIGTTYGGDGSTNFNLPDLRGRSPVCFGQLTGGTNYVLGQTAGAEQVTLTSATVPAHNHTISVNKAAATAMIPGPGNAPANVGANFYYCNESQAGTVLQTAPQTVASDGGGNQPHTNIQPSLVLSYVIAVNGLFPSFNN
jgi:microcystin-dependent protein